MQSKWQNFGTRKTTWGGLLSATFSYGSFGAIITSSAIQISKSLSEDCLDFFLSDQNISKQQKGTSEPSTKWLNVDETFFSFGCVSLLVFVCLKIELLHWSISWQLFCNKSWKYLSGLSWTKDDLLLSLTQSPSSKMQMTNQQRDLPLALGNHNYFVQFHCFFISYLACQCNQKKL